MLESEDFTNMTSRRKVLTQLAAGAAALPATAFGAHASPAPDEKDDCTCVRPGGGPYADYFPNVVVRTHENRKALFYSDLLRGKTVLINCMSIENDAVYPVTANLVRVQRLLGERVGRDVFIYSVTVDPERDTPRALREFAARHGVGPGWLFLTGSPAEIESVRGRLFTHPAGQHAANEHAAGVHRHEAAPVRDCSMGLVRYGNEAVGLWGSVPAKAEPEWIARRIEWVAPRAAPSGPPRRKNPVLTASAFDAPARTKAGS